VASRCLLIGVFKQQSNDKKFIIEVCCFCVSCSRPACYHASGVGHVAAAAAATDDVRWRIASRVITPMLSDCLISLPVSGRIDFAHDRNKPPRLSSGSQLAISRGAT